MKLTTANFFEKNKARTQRAGLFDNPTLHMCVASSGADISPIPHALKTDLFGLAVGHFPSLLEIFSVADHMQNAAAGSHQAFFRMLGKAGRKEKAVRTDQIKAGDWESLRISSWVAGIPAFARDADFSARQNHVAEKFR
jgi:hypothetical protein